MNYKHLLFFSLIFIIGCSTSQSIKNNDDNSYDIEFIDYLFSKYDGNQPSATVLVIKNGELEFAKSYGYADLENSILATPNTNYRIASVTKQFTAMAIMILIEKGKLTFDTKITDVFPEFPKYGNEINVRHLLTHRSGLVRYNRFIKKDSKEQMLDQDVLEGLLETDSTYFEPGSKYAYSNTGYAVLAQIVEKISGLSFPIFMKKEIFEPLGMTNSKVLELDKIINNRAYGYLVKDSKVTLKDQSMTSAIQGDGGVYTSVLDYYKWDQALYSDKLIPVSKLEEAFISYDENGKSSENGYGYGWKVQYEDQIKILSHGGSSTGFGSHVIRIPDEKMTVAIFTNKNKSGSELSNKTKSLVSHFSEGKFKMPITIVVGREIAENGIDKGIKLYNEIKSDTFRYEISKGGVFNFAIDYVNENRNSDALSVFEQLTIDYSDYFGGYYGKAVVFKKQNRKKEAIEYFKKTIEFCSDKEQWAINHSKKMIAQLNKE